MSHNTKDKPGTSYGSFIHHRHGPGHELELDEAKQEKAIVPAASLFRKRLGWIATVSVLFFFVFLLTMPDRHSNSSRSGGDSSSSTVHKGIARLFYTQQLIDHDHPKLGTYSQKYFEQMKHFGGPGYPIFLILGGEDPLEGILYPFVSEVLVQRFSAYTMTVEHRFFGDSWPVAYGEHTNQQLKDVLTPDQAIRDFIRIVQHKQKELGCGLRRGLSNYCPVMVVGCSYPGFLAALLRLRYSDVIDMGYVASAPLYLYSHSVDKNAYYDKLSKVAEESSPGCASAVRSTLLEVQQYILDNHGDNLDVPKLASKLSICERTVPEYIQSADVFSEELMMVVATHFADNNMDFYPPTADTEFRRACRIFEDESLRPTDRVGAYLRMIMNNARCFDMMTELPPGPNGTISSSDWSGCAGEPAGWMWDFLSCLLQPQLSMSSSSMFPPRRWTSEWLASHCQRRFDLTPNASALNNRYHFTDFTNVTRLLLTNGLNDGWSVASVLVEPPHSFVKVINFPAGAHHSDLTHVGPSDADTPEIKAGHVKIEALVAQWLKEVRTA